MIEILINFDPRKQQHSSFSVKYKLILQHASYILLFGNSFTYDTKLTLHQMEIGDWLRKNENKFKQGTSKNAYLYLT